MMIANSLIKWDTIYHVVSQTMKKQKFDNQVTKAQKLKLTVVFYQEFLHI